MSNGALTSGRYFWHYGDHNRGKALRDCLSPGYWRESKAIGRRNYLFAGADSGGETGRRNLQPRWHRKTQWHRS